LKVESVTSHPAPTTKIAAQLKSNASLTAKTIVPMPTANVALVTDASAL
jgi:hypothetical protein